VLERNPAATAVVIAVIVRPKGTVMPVVAMVAVVVRFRCYREYYSSL